MTMELTPIKIPGKRKHLFKEEGRDSQKANNSRGQTSKVTGGPGKGKFQTRERKKRSLKNLKSKRKWSLLETLPTEILEKVFLYCFSVELPRSSPVIAGRLSSQMIYHYTTIAAFSPSWDRWQAENTADAPHAPSCTRQASFQSKVLSCRWLCIAVILQAKTSWMNQTGAQLNPLWFIEASDTNSLAYPFAVSCGSEMQLTVENYFYMDFACFSEYCQQEPPNTDIWHSVDFSVTGDIEKSVQIPASLLVGPWSVEQLSFLFWVVKAGAQINWVSSTSGEVALDGLKTAISIGDTTAMVLLCWFGVARKIDEPLLSWALRNAGGNKVSVLLHLLLALESIHQCMECYDTASEYMDEYKANRELMIMKDEAMRSGDKDLLDLSESLLKSTRLRMSLQRRHLTEEGGH